MDKRDKIVIVSGEYDPLSIEDLHFLQECKSKGDLLCVGIHSDWYMQWARGGFVQNYETRREILTNIKFIDEIFTFDDSDGTVCNLLKIVKYSYPNSNITYVSHEDMKDMPEYKIRGITFETMK